MFETTKVAVTVDAPTQRKVIEHNLIGIVDHNRVELSNLNRQVLHWDKDVGRRKVDSAAEKLKKLNEGVEIEAIDEMITEANVLNLWLALI